MSNEKNDDIEERLAATEERLVHLANCVRAFGMRTEDMHLVEMVDAAMLHPDGVTDVGNFFGETEPPAPPPVAGNSTPPPRGVHVPPARPILNPHVPPVRRGVAADAPVPPPPPVAAAKPVRRTRKK